VHQSLFWPLVAELTVFGWLFFQPAAQGQHPWRDCRLFNSSATTAQYAKMRQAHSSINLPHATKQALLKSVATIMSGTTTLSHSHSQIQKTLQKAAATAGIPLPQQRCHHPKDSPPLKPAAEGSGGGRARVGALLHECEGGAVVRIDVSFPARLHRGAGGVQDATPGSGPVGGSRGATMGVMGEDAAAAALADWQGEMAAMLGGALCFTMERLGEFSVRVTAPVEEFQVGPRSTIPDRQLPNQCFSLVSLDIAAQNDSQDVFNNDHPAAGSN